MIELLVIVIAFILMLLIIVWAHYLNQNRHAAKVDNSFRDETNVRLYHEHKAEIEKDFQQGSLDEESYQYLLTELEQSLLQDIEDNSNEAKEVVDSRPSLSIIWPASISLFILIFSFTIYNQEGSFDLIVNTPKSQGEHQSLDPEQQAIVQLKKLKTLTEQEPKNSDAWYSLGQALVGIGEFDDALNAFDQVIAIDGEHADLFGAKAQASYYQNNQKITPIVKQYIDKALALDSRDPSTNILLGMDQFVNKRFQQAIDYWQLVVNDNRPSVNVEALKSAINEALNRLSLTGEKVANINEKIGPQLAIHVTMTEEIIEQLSQGEDRVVFIYAIPTEGSRMPVAAIKVNASDLPLDVVLNDARAMTPQAKLSDVSEVNLFAIISTDGGAGIKPGDFKAELNNISVNQKESLKLVIDSLVE